MKIGELVICEGCETKNATLTVNIPSFYSFTVTCTNCGWNEPIESIDELMWYLSEALVIDEESLFVKMMHNILTEED